MFSIKNIEQLQALVGQEVATSEYKTITQEMVNQFAAATGDFQWIHVDTEKAKSGPFGSTIAHGFMTLSLIAGFADATLSYGFAKMGINYGCNKVRFISPVPTGSRLRARFKLLGIEPIAMLQGACHQVSWEVTIEREGADKPACVAQTIGRLYS
jgi:acyl dehydratase